MISSTLTIRSCNENTYLFMFVLFVFILLKYSFCLSENIDVKKGLVYMVKKAKDMCAY